MYVHAGVYEHYTVNHSRQPHPERVVAGVRNLKGVEIGTQRIEQEWNQLRTFLAVWWVDNLGLRFRTLQLYCSEFTWRRNKGLYPERVSGSVFKELCKLLGRDFMA